MTLTIELPPELERRLAEEAARHGQAPAEFVRAVVEEKLAVAPHTSGAKLANPQERARAFREWAESHSRDTPLLSEEAIRRESIYGERG
jgi:hypothetical protein